MVLPRGGGSFEVMRRRGLRDGAEGAPSAFVYSHPERRTGG
jgi:hypothetical protein